MNTAGTLVDANVLLDVLTDDSEWFDWSAAMRRRRHGFRRGHEWSQVGREFTITKRDDGRLKY